MTFRRRPFRILSARSGPPAGFPPGLPTACAAVLFFLLAAFPSLAAGPAENGSYTVAVATSPSLGSYLVDARGITLYYSTNDLPGASNCSGGCLAVWPPFFASRIATAPALRASDFGYIVRDKGRRQVTYKGWPLYYYSRDWAPGDTNGQGLYGSWYVVQPALFGPRRH